MYTYLQLVIVFMSYHILNFETIKTEVKKTTYIQVLTSDKRKYHTHILGSTHRSA